MVYGVSENATYTKQPIIPSVAFTYTRKLKLELKGRCLRITWILINISIKLRSVVCYKPMDVTHVIQFVCYPVDIHRTTTYNGMQFNA